LAKHTFTGRVQRLYVAKGWTRIRIEIPTADQPEENYFVLRQDHPNYNALYSLALSAAVNGNELSIRTEEDINAGDVGNVRYMVVDWRT
jgi:hypothetical protein